MPPNTTSLIQPMDQGVIACFKKHYLKHTFKQMFDMLEENKQLTLRDFWRNYNIADALENINKGWQDVTLRDFWRNYNIADALENINKGWQDVTETTMNAVWKNLWPDCIRTDSVSLVEAANEDVAETIAVGRQLEAEGFSDLNLSDIEEYIESHDVELETNDLIELSVEYKDKEQDIEDALRDDVKESTSYLFTTPNIKEYIAMIQTAIDFITKIDPDIERSSFIRRGLQAQIAPYDLIIKERQQASKQQTKIFNAINILLCHCAHKQV
ncbi:DDE superfamily endonuclease [Popillia japonica]|uniref:DDE superfamily endonuclease n=1 Tax=Popillia japonica TaxID=7064 RepID=A0AAW1IG50_POPJA